MLIHITTASPPYKVTQTKATEELKTRMGLRPAVARLFDAALQHSGIETRYVVVPDAELTPDKRFYPLENGVQRPDTKTRMTEYEHWTKVLAKEAVAKLMNETHSDPSSIRRMITVSCTGFYAPGVDQYLINEFHLPGDIRRTHIGFMGCAAALIGLTSVLESLHSANDLESTTLLVAVELCSLHLQTEPTRDNILANMIFADGCAAALFSRNPQYAPQLHLLSTHSHLFPNTAGFMGWKIGNTGFEMILSPELPRLILDEAVPVVGKILAGQGIDPRSIRHWVLHPGGRAILDSLQNGLQISDEDMRPSRTVLKNYGNMSSASILFVMKDLLRTRTIEAGEVVCAIAFGPGLTMEIALLKGA
ncbi:MAG: type III polyketide synthase [Ignavibacteriae bacterium]|nr:MAG: type III polyketide synthase [Ignavibacteriota bacterium]